VNRRHLELCSSDAWAETVRDEILPWVVGTLELGDSILELGPGPGRATEKMK
jgi:hypothetical protein